MLKFLAWGIANYMYPRRIIIPSKSCVHVFFRCHDRNFFLEREEVKEFLITLMAKNKDKYGIKIFDFAIMDNHVHLFIWAPDAIALGNFMRTVESQLARYINKIYNRDSQAIRDRYKSRVVTGSYDHYTIIQYIYLNRYKVDRTMPDRDKYCSAHWRKFNPYQIIENPKNEEEIENNLKAKLLDDYLDVVVAARSKTHEFMDSLIADAILKLNEILFSDKFNDPYTIGDEPERAFRKEYINSFKRGTDPPNHESRVNLY
jgi:REP element-mobilizing transposase RayT